MTAIFKEAVARVIKDNIVRAAFTILWERRWVKAVVEMKVVLSTHGSGRGVSHVGLPLLFYVEYQNIMLLGNSSSLWNDGKYLGTVSIADASCTILSRDLSCPIFLSEIILSDYLSAG